MSRDSAVFFCNLTLTSETVMALQCVSFAVCLTVSVKVHCLRVELVLQFSSILGWTSVCLACCCRAKELQFQE